MGGGGRGRACAVLAQGEFVDILHFLVLYCAHDLVTRRGGGVGTHVGVPRGRG